MTGNTISGPVESAARGGGEADGAGTEWLTGQVCGS